MILTEHAEDIIFNGHGPAARSPEFRGKGDFMIRISQLKLPISHGEAELRKKIAKSLRCRDQDFLYEILRQSLDARHKEDKKFVYTVDVTCRDEKKILRKVHDKNIMSTNEKRICFSRAGNGTFVSFRLS